MPASRQDNTSSGQKPPARKSAEAKSPEATCVEKKSVEKQSVEKKSQRTQAVIVSAALELFAEQGYDATTMRQIAQRAGVSVGNSYYYFESKEQLIQAFYTEFAEKTAEGLVAATEGVSALEDRIKVGIEVWFTLAEPYHRFFHVFLRSAADFDSPNSPFSASSQSVRARSIEAWRHVFEGAEDAPNASSLGAVADRLPQLLWLYGLGLIAAWSQDPTPDKQRSRAILARTAPPLAQAIKLSATPLAAPLALQVVGLLDALASLRNDD
jgi:AcrR family transcriptional regulator